MVRNLKSGAAEVGDEKYILKRPKKKRPLSRKYDRSERKDRSVL